MQPVDSSILRAATTQKSTQEEKSEAITVGDIFSTVVTMGVVLVGVIYYKEIGNFLRLSKKAAEDTPNSLVTNFNISPLNDYYPSPAQKAITLPRELPMLPSLICLEVQKVAKDLCSNTKDSSDDVCGKVKDFCTDLPEQGFIEQISDKLALIEKLVLENISPKGYQMTISLKELLPLEKTTSFFCSIESNENGSIVANLNANLYKLVRLAALKSSEIFHGYIPAEHLQNNPNSHMNSILNFGAPL